MRGFLIKVNNYVFLYIYPWVASTKEKTPMWSRITNCMIWLVNIFMFFFSKPKGRDFRCYLVIFESFLFISSIYHSKIWGVFQSPSWIMLVLVCLGCYGCLKTWKWPLVWVHVVKGWKCFILLFWMRPISIFNFFLEHFRSLCSFVIYFLCGCFHCILWIYLVGSH